MAFVAHNGPSATPAARSKRRHEVIIISDDEAEKPVTIKTKKPKAKAKIEDSELDEADVFELEDPEFLEKAERGEVDELPAPFASLQDRRSLADVACPIFKFLCEKIFADDDYEHVIDYLDSQTVSAVYQFIQDLVESNPGLKRVMEEELWHDVDALKAIGNGDDIYTKSAGWYADIVTDEADDQYVKMYVGQAFNICRRIADHHRRMKDGERSLHYSVITSKPSRKATFVVLGVWEPDAAVKWASGLQDIVEMYLSLVFQSMPTQKMAKYLPPQTIIRQPEVALQVASPLIQGINSDGRQIRLNALSASTDPEVVEYYQKRLKEISATGHAAQKADQYRALTNGLREGKGTKIREDCRDPVPERPEEFDVEVRCFQCKNVRIDPAPRYRKSDGAYVCRPIVCYNCEPTTTSKGKFKRANPTHNPTDSRLTVPIAKIRIKK